MGKQSIDKRGEKMEGSSFVFYPSFKEMIDSLPREMQLDVYTAITDYGVYGIINDKDPYVKALLCMAIPNIEAAKDRYEKAKQNGAKGKDYGVLGGRPSKASVNEILELAKNGLTQQQIADQLNISISTVKRVTAHNRSKPLNINIDINKDININKDKKENIEIEDDTDTDQDIKRDINNCELPF